MTHQIDQLALTRLAFEISDTVENIQFSDLEQDLWTVTHSDEWANGVVISEQHRLQVYSANLYANLGQRSLQLMNGVAPDSRMQVNPLFDISDELLAAIITPDDVDVTEVLNSADVRNLTHYNLDAQINNVFEKTPEYMGEYWVKRCLALSIFRSKNRPPYEPDRSVELLSNAFDILTEASTVIQQAHR